MHRRQWLLLTVTLLATFQLPSATAPYEPQRQQSFPAPFGFESVQRLAQLRAAQPYRQSGSKLPESLARLGYDQYREIRFKPANALWHNASLFEVQFFHRGFTYDRKINVWEVTDGGARPVTYKPTQFDFGKVGQPKDLPPDLGFAGLRVHYPLHTPEYKDELIVFLGASYFRVLGRNQIYGASARGLAINVATTGGEEFPYFTDFFLVRPPAQQRTLTIYALLDSPSVAGAYHFEVRPGTMTAVEVSATLYPRQRIDKVGLAPLTSMFLYGEDRGSARQIDDFRPEVHDSDGLLAQTANGEWLWRPLINPHALTVASFADENPHGFGLSQRDRDFNHYQDAEARYQMRPSYWVAPLGAWGKGGVELVEIPSDEEIHDNIVAYWVPATPLRPRRPFNFSYLLTAYATSPLWPPAGRAIATRTAPPTHGRSDNSRRMLVDFAGGDLDVLGPTQPIKAQIVARGGEVDDLTVERLPENGTWRAAFRLNSKNGQPVDLRCYLTLYGEALTETWTYLWTP
ncbi:MAG: glucan biosynthesis protein [Steroidobacterales bacterium]